MLSDDAITRSTERSPSERIRSRGQLTYPAFKRCSDVVGAIALGLFFLPLLCILAMLVRLDGGSAFFFQQRLGRNGEVFRFWKLRTMAPDAEQALARLLRESPEAKEEWDRTQKLRQDPRVTPLGRLLRKYSFDELPQLWNVLRGDMSMIGPRPMFVAQRDLYPGIPYAGLRPGITGLWQVTDRNASTFADRARYDHIYEQRLSLRMDLWIVLRTFRAVFIGTGC